MTEEITKDNDKGWLATNLEDPAFRRLYIREDLIEEFLHQIEAAMRDRGVSRAQLAGLLGCSGANVTRIMRRTTNLTAATMADLASALDLRVRVQLEQFTTWAAGRYLGNVAGAAGSNSPCLTGSTSTSSPLHCESRLWRWPSMKSTVKPTHKLPSNAAKATADGQAA